MERPDEELAAARLWAVSRCPYLASALFALSPVWVDGIGTFATDAGWRLYLDPACLGRWSVEECGAVLVHEAHHLLRDHCGRAKAMGVSSTDHRRFNIAADLEINDDLGDLPLPGGLHPEQFGFGTGELAEAYFDWLEGWRPVVGWNCGSGAHGHGQAWDDPSATGVRAGEADLIRQQVAVEVRAHHKLHGNVPGGLARWAEAFLEPTVDWRRLLAGAVRASLSSVAGSIDFSYQKPNRRTGVSTAPRVILPALRQPTPRVAVVIDTSGSMSQVHLETALGELRGVFRLAGVAGEHVTVLPCDLAVHTTQRVFSASDVTLAGGGGTDMGVGLAAAAGLRPPPDVIIVMTDGFTPWPDQAPRQRVIVALIGDEGSSPAWAHTVSVRIVDRSGQATRAVPARQGSGWVNG
jgi:predicted metal-dependent peptidase